MVALESESADASRYTAAVTAAEVEPTTAISRIPALDGVRGVAILLVVFHHFGVIADFPGPHRIAVGRFLERAFYAGWAGVDLFFVLSGFLITSILLASRNDADYFKTFYSRRALRIFPLYFGTLLLGLVILPILRPLPPEFAGQSNEHALWLWTYTSNIAYAIGAVATFGVFDIYWSLAIEEQFYGIWPWLVRFARPVMLALVCAGVVVGALALRAYWLAHGGEWARIYRFTPTRLDELATGALVALAVRHARVRSTMAWIAPVVFGLAVVVLAALLVLVNPFYSSAPVVSIYGPTVLAMCFGSGLFLVATNPAGRLASALTAPWLRAWGRISYGIYVWHWPLRLAMEGPSRPAGRDGIRRALPAGRNLHDRRTGWFVRDRVAELSPVRTAFPPTKEARAVCGGPARRAADRDGDVGGVTTRTCAGWQVRC